MMMPIRTASCVLATALYLSPQPALAQHVIEHTPGVVSVKADDVPLGEVLRELTSLAQFSRLRIDPSADERRVTASIDTTLLHLAIVEVLRAADVDFVFAGSASGQPFRLVAAIFEVTEGVQAGPAVAASVPPVERPALDEADGSDQDTNAQADAAKTSKSVAALSGAVAPPPVGAQAAGFVTLPFPDVSGAPIVEPVTPGASRSTLPFPAAAVSSGSRGATPAVTPAAFPELQRYIESLTPPR